MKALVEKSRQQMEQSLEHLRAELTKIRTGRASLGLVQDVRVEAYGQQMPLHQVATLNIPEPRLITIQPWDASLIGAIERAILQAQLGLSPGNDGHLIRLPIPPLTEDRRKELVKVVKRIGEETKVAIRNGRRDANESLKEMEKAGAHSEDDVKRTHQDIQKLTDAIILKVDETVAVKEKEIMTV
ncbi:MAG: ribosome recycling factor [Deltaproteobacteria bacterium]|nr:ribosome recycling factor [Deltaproteobacteria bacterium]